MTITVDITGQQEARLSHAASKRGVPPEQIVRDLLEEALPELPPTPVALSEGNRRTIEFLQQTQAAADAMTPEEKARESALWNQLERNMNETRRLEGRPPAFP